MTGFAAIRIPAYAGVSWRAQGLGASATTGRWQDKRAHGALRSDGLFYRVLRCVPHRAALSRTVHATLIFLIFHFVLHRVGPRHGR